MAKKKIKVGEDVEEVDGTFLKNEDVLTLELLMEKRRSQRLEVEKKDAILVTALTKVELVKLHQESMQQKTVLIRNEKAVLLQQYRIADKEYMELVKLITKNYNLGSHKWGFDPDTGEVKFSDEE